MRGQNNEENPTRMGYLKAFMFGQLAGAISFLVIALLFALLYMAIDLPFLVLSVLVLVEIALAGAVSGYVSAGLVGKRGLIIGGINGAIGSLLFLVLGLLFFSSGISWGESFKMILILFSSICGGIFSVNRKKIRI